MKKATYKGKVRDKNGYAVHLFYEYRGITYMITDEHNGYSETMATKHYLEQKRIDEMLEQKSNSTENAQWPTGLKKMNQRFGLRLISM